MNDNFSIHHQSTFRFIGFFLGKQWVIFLIQFLLCLSWSTKEALFPFFIKNMINIIHENSEQNHVVLNSLILQGFGLLTVWLTMELAMRLQGILALRSFPELKANIRTYLFDYVLGYPYDHFNKTPTGNTTSKISELPRACENILEIVLLHLSSIGGAVLIGIIVLWNVNYRFAALFTGWLLLHLGLSFYFSKNCHVTAMKHSNATVGLTGKISDVLSNILNVLLFSRHQYELDCLKHHQQKEIRRDKKARWALEYIKIYQSIFTAIYMLAMLSCLIFAWSNKIITIGDFTLIPMLSFSLLGMVWWFSNQIQIFFREVGNIKAGLELLNVPYDIEDSKTISNLIIDQGQIKFHEVTFHYPDGHTFFDKVSVHIPGKQKVGIIGMSGAGKTTFIQLLLRLHNVQEGYISIDLQDISKVSQASLRTQISVIPQEISLFNRTLFENIHYGKLEASIDEVYEAAELAGCNEFATQLPNGYKTLVGERGIKLSGGQRQRVAIAGAILKNAPILILDEATGSLDAITESDLLKRLHTFLMNKTVIVISHKASTLEWVDRILLFEQGKIVADNIKSIVPNITHIEDLVEVL